MSTAVIALPLCAAVLHATWNAALRSGADRLWFVTVMSFASTLAAIPFVLLLPAPLKESWPYLGFSALLQVVYSFLLAYAYHLGELGQVYPIVRGSVPLLVAVGGFLLAGQRLGGQSLVGIAMICAAIFSQVVGSGRAERRSLVVAIVTAFFVASYVIADALGVRLAGNPQSYAGWIWVLYGALMPAGLLLLRGRKPVALRTRDTWKALAAGLLSFGSYGLVITALALGDAGPITALRETSIVFAALIGRTFLGEALTRRRALVCLAVTAGAVLIGYAR
ncbi:MAG TPA: EamA family transporter [Steroidobacteraceae bacterium]|nr:EamA family transporter [Steroidobacteraceae bacterium]